MNYTVTQENYDKAIEILAFINCQIRAMERKHGASVCNYTVYNTQTEKLRDEKILLSVALGIDIATIEESVSTRTHQLELAE